MSYRLHSSPRRRGVGEANWWDGAKAGDIRNGMLYTGSGWTSVPGASISSRAPQPTVAPAYAGVQDLNQYLARVVEQAENIYLGQGAGANSPAAAQQARDFAEFAREFCLLYPDAAGCGNPSAIASQAAGNFLAYAQRVDGYKANPSSATGEPVYSQPVYTSPVVQNNATAPAQNQTQQNQTAAPVYPVSAVLTNTTRPGDAIRVGDSWRLDIIGAPNSAVTISATQNSKSLGTTLFGNTNAGGALMLTGKMTSAELGAWQETVNVGGRSATISFFVYDAQNQTQQNQTAAPVYPVSAVLTNTTRPGDAIRVGDSWRLDIIGAPNSAVTISATQNSKSLGTTLFGNTNAGGALMLTGKMTSAELGAWQETVNVGGRSATISFFVYDAIATGTNTGNTTNTNTGNQTTPPPPNYQYTSPQTNTEEPWLSQETIWTGVPNWALLAGGAVAAYAAFGANKR